MLKVLKGTLPVLPPNRRFHYSNLGIAVLGRALAHAEGNGSYEELVAQYITQPLGMVNATFNTSVVLEQDLIATGSEDFSFRAHMNMSVSIPHTGAEL